MPRRIIDTGDYLYLLTDTRLYVLRNGVLLTLIDISEGGDVVVAQTGFGLLEKKRFRRFDEGGSHMATVLSKAPIRRVYQKPDAVIVETRTLRLRVGVLAPGGDSHETISAALDQSTAVKVSAEGRSGGKALTLAVIYGPEPNKSAERGPLDYCPTVITMWPSRRINL